MPLINCKVESKLKWINYRVLSAAGAANANTNSNSIIFTIKDARLSIPVLNFSSRDN